MKKEAPKVETPQWPEFPTVAELASLAIHMRQAGCAAGSDDEAAAAALKFWKTCREQLRNDVLRETREKQRAQSVVFPEGEGPDSFFIDFDSFLKNFSGDTETKRMAGLREFIKYEYQIDHQRKKLFGKATGTSADASIEWVENRLRNLKKGFSGKEYQELYLLFTKFKEWRASEHGRKAAKGKHKKTS